MQDCFGGLRGGELVYYVLCGGGYPLDGDAFVADFVEAGTDDALLFMVLVELVWVG